MTELDRSNINLNLTANANCNHNAKSDNKTHPNLSTDLLFCIPLGVVLIHQYNYRILKGR